MRHGPEAPPSPVHKQEETTLKSLALLCTAGLLLSAAAPVVWADKDAPSAYVGIGLFSPSQDTYNNGWEISAVAPPDRNQSAGWRLGFELSFFSTAGYVVTQDVVVPPGDQVQFALDAGYVVQFGGKEKRSAYAGGGLTLLEGSWSGPQGNVDDDTVGWHLVLGTRLSDRFLLEAEWVDASFGAAFAHEEAGGLTVRAGYGF